VVAWRGLSIVFAALVAGCGHAELPSSGAPELANVQRLLAHRLQTQNLSYRYVVCVSNGHRFGGQAVMRCNVNFNAPHIEVYCSVVRDGRLLTDHDEPAIPCPRDDRGKDPPLLKSS